jgi:hypothetical protein
MESPAKYASCAHVDASRNGSPVGAEYSLAGGRETGVAGACSDAAFFAAYASAEATRASCSSQAARMRGLRGTHAWRVRPESPTQATKTSPSTDSNWPSQLGARSGRMTAPMMRSRSGSTSARIAKGSPAGASQPSVRSAAVGRYSRP